MTDRLVSVAVPVPALGLLTYRVPPDQPMPARGARVVVPLGKRTLTGVVVGEGASFDRSFVIRDVREILDDEAFVPTDVVALTEWVSDYYLSGPGAALAAALPPHGLTARADSFKTVRIAQLTAAGRHAAEGLDQPDLAAVAPGAKVEGVSPQKLGARQREALLVLAGVADGLSLPALAERGIPAATVTRLKSLGLVAIGNERIDRDPFPHAVSAPARAHDGAAVGDGSIAAVG